MTPYWLYSRLDMHVGASDASVTQALHEYADAHVIGGREQITNEHVRLVLAEHHEARELYAFVTGSI